MNPYQSPAAGLEQSSVPEGKPRLSRASRNAIAAYLMVLIAPLACFVGWTLPRVLSGGTAGSLDWAALGAGLMIGIVGIALADFAVVARMLLVSVYAFAFVILMTIVGMYFVCYVFGDCV